MKTAVLIAKSSCLKDIYLGGFTVIVFLVKAKKPEKNVHK